MSKTAEEIKINFATVETALNKIDPKELETYKEAVELLNENIALVKKYIVEHTEGSRKEVKNLTGIAHELSVMMFNTLVERSTIEYISIVYSISSTPMISVIGSKMMHFEKPLKVLTLSDCLTTLFIDTFIGTKSTYTVNFLKLTNSDRTFTHSAMVTLANENITPKPKVVRKSTAAAAAASTATTAAAKSKVAKKATTPAAKLTIAEEEEEEESVVEAAKTTTAAAAKRGGGGRFNTAAASAARRGSTHSNASKNVNNNEEEEEKVEDVVTTTTTTARSRLGASLLNRR